MIKQKNKFKAWSKTYSKMSTSRIIISASTFMHNVCISFDNGVVKTPTDEILLQFTGLTDKNGIEIYEGDVLVHPEFSDEDFKNGDDDICVVEYNDDLTRFLLTFHSCFGGEGYSGQSEHDQLCRYVANGYCVKGNIYEHFKDYL